MNDVSVPFLRSGISLICEVANYPVIVAQTVADEGLRQRTCGTVKRSFTANRAAEPRKNPAAIASGTGLMPAALSQY